MPDAATHTRPSEPATATPLLLRDLLAARRASENSLKVLSQQRKLLVSLRAMLVTMESVDGELAERAADLEWECGAALHAAGPIAWDGATYRGVRIEMADEMLLYYVACDPILLDGAG